MQTTEKPLESRGLGARCGTARDPKPTRVLHRVQKLLELFGMICFFDPSPDWGDKSVTMFDHRCVLALLYIRRFHSVPYIGEGLMRTLAIFVVAAVFSVGCDDGPTQDCETIAGTLAEDVDTILTSDSDIRVMTRNLYLGANVGKIADASNDIEIVQAVNQVYEDFLDSQFRNRIAAIADEIETINPDLIGLQEVVAVFTQEGSDFLAEGGGQPAEELVADFLVLLMDELKSRNLDYVDVSVSENADVELPAGPVLAVRDVRLIDRDVILARANVVVTNKTSSVFEERFSVSRGEDEVEIPRGWQAVDADINGTTIRFVNTHLDPIDVDIRKSQAQELIDALAEEPLPIILVGDFNTDAAQNQPAYQLFVSQSPAYQDAWIDPSAMAPSEGGTTRGDLGDICSALSQRIDLVFTRGLTTTRIGVITTGVRGSEYLEDEAVWPSDHAGVVAGFTL